MTKPRRTPQSALNLAVRTGMVESFVCACRGFPELTVLLLENTANHQELVHIFTIAGDVVPLMQKASISQPFILSLSAREKEVLSLLRPGNVEPRDRQSAVYQPRDRQGPRASHLRKAGRQISNGGSYCGRHSWSVITRYLRRPATHVAPRRLPRRSQSPASFRDGTHRPRWQVWLRKLPYLVSNWDPTA